MVRRAAVCTNFLPKTIVSDRYNDRLDDEYLPLYFVVGKADL